MKDVVLYVFFCSVYGIIALHFFAKNIPTGSTVTWYALGYHALLFTAVATLARWTVMAFKKRNRLLKGQKIVGVEESVAPPVIEVIKPVVITQEIKKPRLRKRK
ncbi:MAG TPA: hypothetical protein PLY93_07405 [Turneriella sp.]|nr:hypothetical protein [Turneriella sp.]